MPNSAVEAHSRSELAVSFGLVCLTVSNPKRVRPAGTPPDRPAPKEIAVQQQLKIHGWA